MAIKKKKNRVRYNKRKRVAMRQGGRVQLAKGTTTKKKKVPVNPRRPVYENPMDDPLYDPVRQPRPKVSQPLGRSDKRLPSGVNPDGTPFYVDPIETGPFGGPPGSTPASVPAPTQPVTVPTPAPTQPVVAPVPAPTQPVAAPVQTPPPVFDPNIGQPPKQPTTQPPVLGDPFTDPNHPLYGTIDPAPDYPDFPQPTVSPQPTVPQPTVSPQPPVTPIWQQEYSTPPEGFIPPPPDAITTQVMVQYWNPTTGETFIANNGGWTAPPGWEVWQDVIEQPDMPPIGEPSIRKPWQQPRSPYVQEDGRGDDRGPGRPREPGRPGGPGGPGGPGRPVGPGRPTPQRPNIGDTKVGPAGATWTYTATGWVKTSPAPTATTTTPTETPDTGPWTVYDDEGNLISPAYGLGTDWTNYKTGEGGRTPAQQQEVRDLLQAAAEGKLPEGARIPSPAEVDEAIKSGLMQMDPTRVAEAYDVLKAGQRIGYDPSTGKAIEAPMPDAISADKYRAETIDKAATIDPETGKLSKEATADMQSQALTMDATGVDVDAAQAAASLAKNVSADWSLDDNALISEAIKVAGTDLPRVLRAKKQLRRAGLTEEQINLIGNDPSALEDELMDYTEAERGMIAGLPEEALVSVQMNQLLEGMESGEIPAFARPAVAAVNQMLAARGLSASTVGRDNLFNAIISSAMPLAQSNAQSIKESVFSQRGIEAQAEQMNAQMAQQTAMSNSEKVFGMNMARFSAEQQTELSNSKFLQTVALTDASAAQQAAMQTAASMAQLDLATLDSNTKLAAQNAQAFLGMDMQNLNNKQQAAVLDGQMKQQTLLSNQAADNASKQFNATSENQTRQFMSSMAANMNQFNAQQTNAMTTFNKTQENQAKAAEEQAELEVARLDAQLKTQIDQFNSQQEFAREQWNTQNAQVVEQSNVAWRRQSNTVNTAALNAVNQQNAQNAFGLSTQSMAQLWQEMRDQMDYSFKAWDNDQQRKASLMVAALGNEGASYEGKNWATNLQGMTTILSTFLGG